MPSVRWGQGWVSIGLLKAAVCFQSFVRMYVVTFARSIVVPVHILVPLSHVIWNRHRFVGSSFLITMEVTNRDPQHIRNSYNGDFSRVTLPRAEQHPHSIRGANKNAFKNCKIWFEGIGSINQTIRVLGG